MKKRKKNQSKLWSIGVMAIFLLAAAPSGAKDVFSGETLNVGTGYPDVQIDDYIMVWMSGTLNLYPGAYVDGSIYALGGSTVNIYGGELSSDSYFISVCSGENGDPDPVVTVYGLNFAVNGTQLDDSVTQYVHDSFSWKLTVTYANNNVYPDPVNLIFYSGDIPVYLEKVENQTDDDIEIDIKPGSDENVINLKSRGVVPVAVLTTDKFNAGDLVPDYSISFAGASPVHSTLCDVDGDDDMDMLFHFRTQELDLNENSTEATLTATLKDAIMKSSEATTAGKIIQGTDKVKVKSPKKK